MQGSRSGGDRRSRSRSRTPEEWLPRAGVEQQLQAQTDALERAARLFRELRSEIAQLRAWLADLQRRHASEVDWLQRLTRRVAALELQTTGRAGPAPITPQEPPASPQEPPEEDVDWRGPDR